MVVENNIEFFHRCRCMEARNSQRRLEKSGLTDMVARYCFATFETKSKHQQMMKAAAEAFCEEGKGWFYIGGQPGCGKTHICTAIASHFVNAGVGVQYMVWMEEVTKLKAMKMDEEGYERQMGKWKEAPVLYVDDFFKTERGKAPTAADVNIAFELLNHRYNDESKITILSGEHPIGEMIQIDEALGSRIYQRCGKYKMTIGADPKKNYRLQC